MGRSIQSDLQALRGKGRSKHVRHRTLAVGTGYMNDLILPVGMSRQLIEELHIVCPRLVCPGSDLLKRREPDKEPGEHGLVFRL